MRNPSYKEKSSKESDSAHLEWMVQFHLNRIANRFTLFSKEFYKKNPYKLSIAAWRVLAVLSGKSPLSAVELATETVMEPTQISRAISALMDKDLLSRETYAEDLRKVQLKPTEKGLELFNEIFPKIKESHDALYSVLSESEQRTFEKLVCKIETQSTEVFGEVPGHLGSKKPKG